MNDCHTDNSPDNLMTVCPFCHSRAHFGLAHIQDRGFFIQSPIFTQKTFHLALVPLWFSTELPGLEKVNQYLPVYRQWIENVIQKDRLFLEKAIPNFKDGAHLANLYLLAVKRKDKQVINSLSHQMSRDSLILVPNILHERYQAAAKSWSKSIIKASSNEKIGHWLNGIVGKNLIKMERYLS